MESNIEIIIGDITELDVDVIVNAANKSLLGGGGVDGTIHYKAGKNLDEACKKLGGCLTGDAKLTEGYDLKAKYIIHTVAPKWFDIRLNNKEELLINCYENSYRLAKEKGLKTIAFPCLGAGIYQVPIELSAKISIDEAIKNSKNFDKIYLVCFKEDDYKKYNIYFNSKRNL